MYFENRIKAGEILATDLLKKYRYDNCIVVALSDGGVLVGEQIAKYLHCIITMLLIEDIAVPGENTSFGGVNQDGGFTYNSSFSQGEIDEYNSEFHGYLEERKREAFQRINRLIGDGGLLIDSDMLRDRVVILVSDGLDSESVIDAAVDFLKPIRIKRLVVASPISTVQVVDRVHILADELYILDVKQNFMGINHYYEENNIPTHEETIDKISKIILNWR